MNILYYFHINKFYTPGNLEQRVFYTLDNLFIVIEAI